MDDGGDGAPEGGLGIWHEDAEEFLPKAHNGCTCHCHVEPWVMHVAPCCYPNSMDGMDSEGVIL